MTHIQYAWMIYAFGSIGLCIATWWMFLWAWRFVRYAAVVTVLVFLATPYAIDQQTMIMAPAIFTLVFEGISSGADAIKPLIKLMAGIWLIAIILIAVFVIFTRRIGHHIDNSQQDFESSYPNSESSYPFNQSQRIKRNRPSEQSNNTMQSTRSTVDGLSFEERQAHAELVSGDVPIRAIRD